MREALGFASLSTSLRKPPPGDYTPPLRGGRILRPMVELARTETEFLQRLLLDVQRRGDEELVAAIELALAMLRWDGTTPPALDEQFGLGAAVEMKLGPDAMCAYRQWRTERRRRIARQVLTP